MSATGSRSGTAGIDALLAAVHDPTVTGAHRLPMRPLAVPHPDAASARTGDPAASPWWRSLDGTWQFRMLERPADLTPEWLGVGRSPGGWAPIEVPGAWTLQHDASGQRWDRPHYTNVVMPFGGEPPGVPEVNPTGVYRRVVDTPEEWTGRRTVLRLGAAESVAGVFLDGELVGIATDSRLPSEFDVTGHLRPGRRSTLVVVVVRWSAHSWVEDQDQWWHGGIQRSVTLHSTAPSHLEQLRLVPGWSHEHDAGTLDGHVQVAGPACTEPGWSVEVLVETLAGRRLATTGPAPVPVWDASSEAAQVLGGMFVEPGRVQARLEVPGARQWSHEAPERYRSLVLLRDPAGELVEVAALGCGFRSVEVTGRELLINGRPVLLHGVNLHEHDPERGRAVPEALTRQDLEMMKAHNLNAVRAAHYPHDEHLAELCDELGLYLVDEANVESHGRQRSLCHDPRYQSTMVERVQRMVQRDAHHASIIMWSLGNEAGDGAVHEAAAAWVRREDPSRPVHYEGPVMHDLHAAAPATDVVCPMYPTIDQIVGWARSDHDTRRPLVMCEYSHAMGTSNGSLADYWEAITSHHGLQGGFIWEWVEHGLPLAGTGPTGGTVWGYGGDFGDEPNDVNFVCDGLVAADRTAHPALEEVRWVGRPVAVDVTSSGWLQVENRRWFRGLEDLRARWTVTVDGAQVDSGELDVPELAPGATTRVRAPWRAPSVRTGQEVHATVEWSLRRRTAWAPAGHVVARDQVVVPARVRNGRRGAAPGPDDAAVRQLPDGVDPWSLRPTLFRALTDNDGLRQGWMRGLSGQLARWIDQLGLDRCDWQPGEPRTRRGDGGTVTTATGRLVLPGRPDPVEVRRRVEQQLDGWSKVTVTVRLPPELADLPRVGVEWQLPGTFERAHWFGDGPYECYPDRRSSATVGRWSAEVRDLYVDLPVPQEHGHRTGVRWLALTPRGRGTGLLVVTDPAVGDGTLGAAARHHGDAELWAARHSSDLAAMEGAPTWLYLDAAQRGLGTASCGPDALEPYRVRAGTHTVSFWCAGYDPRRDDPAELAGRRRVQASEG